MEKKVPQRHVALLDKVNCSNSTQCSKVTMCHMTRLTTVWAHDDLHFDGGSSIASVNSFFCRRCSG
ncbi:hypothetical protein TSUD_76600 [Trifolium subterraneum]|uniref:Uncharacterized protein n=1 Tax=Trifolium subterraneum TaxID=3900 RepID=A0A2Z6LRK8_TRISU|nr:hypothetical protein TSUD_76600 [Trifolium subterraneum]